VGWGRHADYFKLLKKQAQNTLIQAVYRIFQGQKEQYPPMTLNLRGQKEELD
jgi:hypothetical protein